MAAPLPPPNPRVPDALRGSSCLRQQAGWPSQGLCCLCVPLCSPSVCLEGAACHLSLTCSPPPVWGLSRASLRTMWGRLLGAGVSLRFVSAWPPLILTAKPRWARGPSPHRGLKEGLCGQECGDRRQGCPPDSLSVHLRPWSPEPAQRTSVSECMRTLCKVSSASCEVVSVSLPLGCQRTRV